MSEEEKIKPEGRPPLNKRGMVSEDDLLIKEAADKVKKGETTELPSEQVLLLFIAEGIYDLNQRMDALLEIFKNAMKDVSSKDTSKGETIKISTTEVKTSPLELAQTEERVKIIVDAFKSYEGYVTIDTESSAQFVKIKPNGFLGGDVFPKISDISKKLGGTYQSKGKDSHFLIPKIAKKETAQIEQPQTKPNRPSSATPPTEVADVEMLFTEELKALLSFTKKDDEAVVIIAPRQFLGTLNFTKIASIVREAGGIYKSAGKESHFAIPLGKK